MADISAQQIPELGRLMTALPQAESNMALQGQQGQLAEAQAGEAQGRTGLLQQQTQRAALEIEMIKDAFNQAKNFQPNDHDADDEKSGVDPTETGIASSLNKKFYLDPAGNPKLLQMANAWAAAGKPEVAAQYEKLNDIMVKSKLAQNQNEANDIFQTSSALLKSAAPLQALLSVRPGSYLNNVGRAIASDPNMSPEEKNAAAAQAIQSASQYSHQYTGRETEQAGDRYVDKNSRIPVTAPPIGLTPGEKLHGNIFEHTPQTVTSGNRDTTVFPDLQNPPGATTPAASGSAPGTGFPAQGPTGQPPISGYTPEQSEFIRTRPQGFESVPSGSKLNQDDVDRMKIYREQAKKLADDTNVGAARAQDSLTQIGRINNLLKAPNLTLGPGSHEYSQFRTVLENWTGTPSGQAAAYQILSKVLNASEMNDLLQQFHSEGAQVRLGAYESRLIMEKLAANPALTKTAIQQMLQWQAADSKYTLDKANVAGALLQAGKSVANFDKEYGQAFPKRDIVDNTLQVLDPKHGAIDYSKVNGKEYTRAEVAATAAKRGIPLLMFQHQLETNGAIIK